MRFNKLEANIEYHAQFESMDSIESVSQASSLDGDSLFLCGALAQQAVMARMRNDGEVMWITTSINDGRMYDMNKCMGITYNEVKEQVAVMVQG